MSELSLSQRLRDTTGLETMLSIIMGIFAYVGWRYVFSGSFVGSVCVSVVFSIVYWLALRFTSQPK
jgi:Zn-dependent protease with chaperone function